MGIPDHAGDGVMDDDKLHDILERVEIAVRKAIAKHAPMHGPHEGHSVIREETEELWDHVKADTGRTAEARKEAEQIAAMAVRYIYDVCALLDPAPKERP